MNEQTRFSYETAYGRLDFAPDSPFWISDIDGISSVDISVFDTQSSGQIGSSITGQSVKPRLIPISGSIFDPVIENREILISAIPPEIPAIFTVYQNGKAWYLDVVPEKTPDILPGNGVQFFQCRLKAAYPYFRSVEKSHQLLFGLKALFEFPFYTGGEWYISQLISGFAYVQNDNNVEIPFRVEFTARGETSNPQLYNVDTGKRLAIRKSAIEPYVMVAGERIIISTIFGERGVMIISPEGIITNGFKYLALDSNLTMQVKPGINTFQVSASENDFNLDARIDIPVGVRSGV
ncbi:MAG: phage tail family protein [Clostridiales bacterium]|nr:phage tail family protein [Clostridiales bacterium]